MAAALAAGTATAAAQDDENGSDGETGAPGEPAEQVTVAMTGLNQFDPQLVHVTVGGTVTWEFGGGLEHNTVAYHPGTNGDAQRIPDGAEPWESELLASDGETFERTFEVPGVYDYACTPHENAGMVGSVIVGWPDPADEPGLEPPSEDLQAAPRAGLESLNEQARGALEDGETTIEFGDYEPGPVDGSDRYYDVDGSGDVGANDVVVYFEHFESEAAIQDNPALFDFNGSGSIGFEDVIALFRRI